MDLGGYAVEREVGRGGMGVVLRARAPDGKVVAIKLLLHAQKAEARARFGREQRLLASFGELEGFVPLVGSGDSPRGPFLVMPFLEGGTLRERMERGPLPIEETRALGIELAKAIGFAHAKGIVHRDLKPENILFTRRGASLRDSGRALVTDLGLAKHFSADTPGSALSISLSKTGESKGTVGYMPPEQVTDSRNVGPPADVFALGAILYECLTGTNPFDADNVHAMIRRASSGEFVPLRKERPEVPAGLARTIERTLAPLPAKRFADGNELAEALSQEEKPERSPIVWALAGLTLVAILGVGSMMLLAPGARPREPEPRSTASSPTAVATPAPVKSSGPARPRVDATKFPGACSGFLESKLAHLDAVLGSYAGHVGQVCMSIAWSPDGKYVLATGAAKSTPGGVWLLDAATGEPVREPESFNQEVSKVAFSPDGRLYVAGAVQGQCRVVETATGKLVGEWQHPNSWLQGVAFAADGKTLASAGEGGFVELHDLTGKLLEKFGPVGWTLPNKRQIAHSPASVGFLPDGRFVSGGREKDTKTGTPAGSFLCLWDPRARDKAPTPFEGHTGFIRDLAVSPQGEVLTAAGDSTVRLWDLKSPQSLRNWDVPAHAFGAALSSDGKLAAAAGGNGFVMIWNTATGDRVGSFEPHEAQTGGVAFSPDGLRLAFSSWDGTVRVREITSGRDVWTHAPGHALRVRALALAGTKLLVSASEDGTCRAWDPATGHELRRLVDHELHVGEGTDAPVNCVSLSPDGHSAAIGRSDGTVRFVDPTSGTELRVFHPGKPAVVNGLAMAGDGKHAFGGDDSFGVKLWNQDELAEDEVALDDSGELDKGVSVDRRVFCVALSPDGTLGLEGQLDRIVAWDVDHRRRAFELPGQSGETTSVTFSRDGQSVLASSADHFVRIWDIAAVRRGVKAEPTLLRGHTERVEAAVFFPDGDRIASASKDRTIRIWSARSGLELDRIDLGTSFDHAMSLAVSLDGKRLFAGTRRGVILRFEVAPPSR